MLLFMVHLCKNDIYLQAFFYFFKILIFQVFRGWKGRKRPKMAKNSVCHTSYLRNHTSYDCVFQYTCIKRWYIQEFFSIFSKLWFEIMLHISGTVDHIIIIMIYAGVFLYFLKKYDIVNVKIIYIFYLPTLTVFLINSCFSNSSINAEQQFWGVPHLFHMCVIFVIILVFIMLS